MTGGPDRPGIIGHADIWRALDMLAAERGLSASALAKAAGLDPTAFNPSKRQGTDGRRRWPGTESLVRALGALDVSLERFAHVVERRAEPLAASSSSSGSAPRPLRAIAWSDLGRTDLFDRAGLPAGKAWEEWPSPFSAGPQAYAVHLDDASLQPAARAGAVLVVVPTAAIRPGDRVLLRATAGAGTLPRAAIVQGIDADRVVFEPIVPALGVAPGPHPIADLHILHRIAAICL
jgi:phage repressor protein C with HTH and peptisase S24 domain